MKSLKPSLARSNSKAAPIALAVQLPSWPWSYTAGIFDVRLTFFGSVVSTDCGAENM